MLKKEIRLNFTLLRNSLSAEELRAISHSISEHSKSVQIWDYQYYHIFLPIANKLEINTFLIVDYLWSINKEIVVPKVKNDKLLEHIKYEKDTELISNKWGIPEPNKGTVIDEELIDVVFIPLLAFDKQGHRVGYGKGYYDRFLSTCRKETVKIGLSHFEPVREITDPGPEDIRLDYCITPSRVYEF